MGFWHVSPASNMASFWVSSSLRIGVLPWDEKSPCFTFYWGEDILKQISGSSKTNWCLSQGWDSFSQTSLKKTCFCFNIWAFLGGVQESGSPNLPLGSFRKKTSLKGLSKKPLTREGEQPQLGDLPTMLINHLLNWMILQVVSHIFWFLPRSLGWFDPIWLSHIFQMGGKNPSTFS